MHGLRPPTVGRRSPRGTAGAGVAGRLRVGTGAAGGGGTSGLGRRVGASVLGV